MSWVFKRTEPGLWTSGYYDPEGRFEPQADHDSAEAAADHVAYLNGSSALGWSSLGAEQREQLVDAVADELERRRAAAPPAPSSPDVIPSAAAAAASLRSLADLLEQDHDFAQLAKRHYFFASPGRTEKLLMCLGSDDPLGGMQAAALAANAAGVEVAECDSREHPGIALKFGALDVQVYCSRDQLDAAIAADAAAPAGRSEAGR